MRPCGAIRASQPRRPTWSKPRCRRATSRAARRAADQFIAIAPSSLRAHYARGLVALQQNDLATARADFSALTAASPSYALAHYDLAVIDVRAGDYAAAENELQAALALSPGYARARFALATLMLRRTTAPRRVRTSPA